MGLISVFISITLKLLCCKEMLKINKPTNQEPKYFHKWGVIMGIFGILKCLFLLYV